MRFEGSVVFQIRTICYFTFNYLACLTFFFFELREHTIISIVEINWNIDDSNLHIHLDFSTRLTRLLLINELRGAFAHRSVSNDLGGARSSILFFFLFGTDRLARLAAMTRATFLSSRGEAGEHHLIVLIRAISSARERLSSGLRVTITVPTGSKWWIEHAGVTTSPLKRAPSRKVEGAIIDGVFFYFPPPFYYYELTNLYKAINKFKK